MKSPIIQSILLVALLVTLSGCPGTVSISYGVWVFTLFDDPDPDPLAVLALAILQHGATTDPPAGYPGNFPLFGGALVWQRSGTTVTLMQDNPAGDDHIFNGTLQSSTSMSGTWSEPGSSSIIGTWTAEWDEEN